MCTCMLTWGIPLEDAKLDLAAGGSRVCKYCTECEYTKYCNGKCTYEYCSLCRFQYHCVFTCLSGVCLPQPCRMRTCRTNEHCYETDSGRGECRCNDGVVCSEDDDCILKANQGDCDFYTCFENRRNCGVEGYMLAYGRKYCNRFGEHYDNFTFAGQKWIKCTRQCLTSALIDNYRADTPAGNGCDEVISHAFLTHVDCYVDCGFCNIWDNNIGALLKVFSVKDLLQLKVTAQITSVSNRCFTGAIDSVLKWARSVASDVDNIASQINEAAALIEEAVSQARKYIDLFKWMTYPYPKL